MKKQQKRRVTKQAQAILFCSVLIWIAASFIAALSAMAFHSDTQPAIFQDYASVVRYRDYAYASEGPQNAEAIAHKESGTWQLLCEASTPISGMSLVQKCEVPIGTARHLKILNHKGMSHNLVVPEL